MERFAPCREGKDVSGGKCIRYGCVWHCYCEYHHRTEYASFCEGCHTTRPQAQKQEGYARGRVALCGSKQQCAWHCLCEYPHATKDTIRCDVCKTERPKGLDEEEESAPVPTPKNNTLVINGTKKELLATPPNAAEYWCVIADKLFRFCMTLDLRDHPIAEQKEREKLAHDIGPLLRKEPVAPGKYDVIVQTSREKS